MAAAPGEREPGVPRGHLASSSWKRTTRNDYGIRRRKHEDDFAGLCFMPVSSRCFEIPSSPASYGLSVNGRRLGPILTPFFIHQTIFAMMINSHYSSGCPMLETLAPHQYHFLEGIGLSDTMPGTRGDIRYFCVWRSLVYPSVSRPDLCKHSPLSQPSTVTQGQLHPRSRSYTLPRAHQLLRSLIPTFPSSRFLTLCTKPSSLPGRSSFSSLID